MDLVARVTVGAEKGVKHTGLGHCGTGTLHPCTPSSNLRGFCCFLHSAGTVPVTLQTYSGALIPWPDYHFHSLATMICHSNDSVNLSRVTHDVPKVSTTMAGSDCGPEKKKTCWSPASLER